MFEIFKQIKTGAAISKALRSLNLDPSPYRKESAFGLLIELIIQGHINAKEAAIALFLLLQNDPSLTTAHHIINVWLNTGSVNSTIIEFATHCVLYRKFKGNGFYGSFEEFLKWTTLEHFKNQAEFFREAGWKV